MKNKTRFTLIILMLICILPIIPWYFLGTIRTMEPNYDSLTHAAGQILGLIGMTMFSITFVLSTRWKFIEKMIGGLDKVYKIHSIFGSLAFMLLLFHPILLVMKFVPSRMDLASLYLLPGHGRSVDFGIIALATMIVLISMTFYINIRYNYWKISHKFLGVAFIFATLHIFLVRGSASRDFIFMGYYAYAGIVSAIGITSFFYTIFLKGTKNAVYIVTSIKRKGKLYDICMEPVSGQIRFRSGQFAFFRFHNKQLGREFHPFSIASKSQSKIIRLIIKDLGDYTSKMMYLKKGTKVSVEGPYGNFTIDRENKDMVWFASGIGITPFVGMAHDISKMEDYGNARLYYCARTKDEMITLDELWKLNSSNFKVIPWCSSERGRIIIKDVLPIDKNSIIYICGSEDFRKSLKKQLSYHGIPKENIIDEDFAFK